MIKSIGRALKQGGIFVLDLANPNFVKQRGGEKGYNKKTQALSNGIILTTEEYVDKDALIIKRSWNNQSYVVYVRLFSLEEIKTMLERAGFEIIETFGSFGGIPLNEETSSRYIIVSRLSPPSSSEWLSLGIIRQTQT